MKYVLSFFVVLATCASSANAALAPAQWTDTTHATLDCIDVQVNVVSTAEVAVLTSGAFGAPQWELSNPLGYDVVGLTVDAEVNTYHTFTFDTPLDGALFYIEDLDTGAVAEINFFGMGVGTLLESSPSISVMGNMVTTTNGSQDGEGELLYRLDGGVTGISIGYHELNAPTDVNFTFAKYSEDAGPAPAAVPEPGSAAVMAGLFGLGALIYWRRRNK